MSYPVTIEDILSAFADWQEARRELEVSESYFNRGLMENEARMRFKIGEKLDAYIDQRIEAATGARP